MTKKIFITMSDELYNQLQQIQKDLGYMTVQEIINSIIRSAIFPNQTPLHKNKHNKKDK